MKQLLIKGINKKYKVIIKNNLLNNLTAYYKTNNKVLLLSDDNIPNSYKDSVKKQYNVTCSVILKHGEKSKNYKNVLKVIDTLLTNNFNKDDVIIALGGGVILDIASLIATLYKRGINLVFIPTSMLSMVDASIGSKNAIDFNNIKNVIGSFYDPNIVLIDPLLLKTLRKRELYSGLCEALKTALIHNEDFYNYIKENALSLNYEKVIYESLKIKKYFIENDKYDISIRHALNFGHTYGHAIEIAYKLPHGIAIGIGMLKVLENPLKDEVSSILEKWHINYKKYLNDNSYNYYILQDKKIKNNKIDLVIVKVPGSFEIKSIEVGDLNG